MARRTTTAPTRQPANLSPEQMRAAIPKLRRRIEELKAFDVFLIRELGDPRIGALKQKIAATLVEIFGADSLEYQRDSNATLLDANTLYFEPSIGDIIDGHKRGIARSVSILETNVALFEEALQDAGNSPKSRVIGAFADLDLHPEISRAAATLFDNGHYSNAVEDACKILDLLVKMRSGRDDMSGTELMQTVFSPKSPVLRFNDLTSETDRSEQQGMMFLFAGAMLAIRNPRAHELIKDNPEQALEYIGFLSTLAKAVDRAKR
jgi:uncharacterized protein (TIGR02391 family)